MRKILFLFTVLMFILPPLSPLVADVTGEIEKNREHPILTDAEISEREWDAGEDGDSSDVNPPHVDDQDRGPIDYITDFLEGLWDGITDIAETSADAIGNIAGNLWDGFTEWAENSINNLRNIGEELWDGFTDFIDTAMNEIGEALSSIWDFIRNIPANLVEFWNSLSDLTKTILAAILAIVLIIGGALLLGIALSVGLIVAIIAGVVLAATAYYQLFGGTELFSFTGALIWALTGGIASGVMLANGAFASILGTLRLGGQLLMHKLRMNLASFSLASVLYTKANGGIIGAIVALAKTSWGKGLIIGNLITLVDYGIKFMNGDDLSFGQIALDIIINSIAGSIGGATIGKIITALKNRNFVKVLELFEINAFLGGMSNVLVTENATFEDFLLGAGLGAAFVIPDIILDMRGISGDMVTVISESIKKIISNIFGNIFGSGAEEKSISVPSKDPPQFNTIKVNPAPNIDFIHTNPNPPPNLSQQEIDIIRSHLETINNH